MLMIMPAAVKISRSSQTFCARLKSELDECSRIFRSIHVGL